MRSIILLLLTCLLVPIFGQAQKKPLDHSVYDSWQTVTNPQISSHGKIITYQICPGQGDTTLVVNNGTKKMMTLPRAVSAKITPNEDFLVCIIRPSYATRRTARIKKWCENKIPKDTLAIINLKNKNIKKINGVSSFLISKLGNDAIAFSSSDTTLIPKKERKDKKHGKPLIIYHLQSDKTDTIKHVGSFFFNRQGTMLVYIQKEKKKMTLGIYDVTNQKKKLISETYPFISKPSFAFEGNKFLYLTSNDTLTTGSKLCNVWQFEVGEQYPKILLTNKDIVTKEKGWGITQYSSPLYSRDGKRIFVGIGQIVPPNDSNIVAFESASLDIWNYNAPMLPPMAKANKQKIVSETCLAVYKDGKLIPLTYSPYDKLHLLNKGNSPYVLSEDMTLSMVSTQWDIEAPVTLSLINLKNNKKTVITTASIEELSISPMGKYITWYDMHQHQWFLYDVNSQKTKDITSSINTCFWNELNDVPMDPEPYGIAGWTEKDKDVILYDRYDLWKISCETGKAICLTKGDGLKKQLTYRYINTKDASQDQHIKNTETMLLSVFDNQTKKRGFATITVAQPQIPTIQVLEGNSYGIPKKAKETDLYIYTKGNFEHPYDLYLTNNFWKSQEKLSAINPQQKDYNWGTVELYKWKAFDGTKLDGLLYKPENFDPKKKYPVMIYFYERYSDNLYNYITPQPSWSIINITFYTSRGYIVFVPDIVYKAGIPGECAYNCIVSGAQSLTKLPWIDKNNMAIQGQSWGGYQVSYLITRTNMFKAAGAGAPVANMTSAYGGIRWGTGMSRQFQYEQTQSRIGRNLWEAPELYISNSPLFKLPNVQTPVLIMHNDADGAVPWYQGIEMFMGLRRLGKPAWLLEYNNEDHNLRQRRNRKDLSIRLQQFFDYYLKGAEKPAWMEKQLPITRKGQYYGYETIPNK